jgi:hypothetical protein
VTLIPSRRIQDVLLAGLGRAIAVQTPLVTGHTDRIRRRMPGAPEDEIVRALERQYLASVCTMGVAVGGAAAAPVVGTTASVALALAEIGTFLEATTLFALAVAEVRGVRIPDLERRRSLVLAILLGESGSRIVEKAAGRTGAHWGAKIAAGIPAEVISRINRVLGKNFVTKYGAKQGILVLGRVVPFGVGAAIGGAGNAALGYSSIRAARRAFGAGTGEHEIIDVEVGVAVPIEIPSGGTRGGPVRDDTLDQLINNVNGFIPGDHTPDGLARSFLAEGWSARRSAWTEYEVHHTWAELVFTGSTSEAGVVFSGVIYPDRLDELADAFRALGLTCSIELYGQQDHEVVRQVDVTG